MDATRIITAQRQVIMAGARSTRTRRLIATRPRLVFKSVSQPGIQRSPLTLAPAAPRILLRRADRDQLLMDTAPPLRIARRQS